VWMNGLSVVDVFNFKLCTRLHLEFPMDAALKTLFWYHVQSMNTQCFTH